jgi:hypothetical protein
MLKMCSRRGVEESIPMQLRSEQLPPLCLTLKFYKASSDVGDFRFAPLPSLVDPGKPKEAPHGELHARDCGKTAFVLTQIRFNQSAGEKFCREFRLRLRPGYRLEI